MNRVGAQRISRWSVGKCDYEGAALDVTGSLARVTVFALKHGGLMPVYSTHVHGRGVLEMV